MAITLTWDKKTLEILSVQLRDLKQALESINIAGGRYGMGILLTTEWGIGGHATWDDNREVIIPEAPLEPGTQYRVWIYIYQTIRNDEIIQCPRVGGEIVFRTAGVAPEDKNPIRNVDLSVLYEGDVKGMGSVRGPITAVSSSLKLLMIRDRTLGPVTFVVYEGTPIMREEEWLTFENLRVGDRLEAEFMGGRAVTIRLEP
jgi:hypothetical protein